MEVLDFFAGGEAEKRDSSSPEEVLLVEALNG